MSTELDGLQVPVGRTSLGDESSLEEPAVEEVDVLVVGSGAAGMVAALGVRDGGLDALVIEKSHYFGGSTARSGGGVWVPNAPALRREGQHDDPKSIVNYLMRLAGDRVSRSRIERFVDEAPRMMEFLESQSDHLANGFFWIKGYSDYHPELGGNPLGRGVWATPIDRRHLGEEVKYVHPGVKRMQLPLGAWITSVDLHDLLALRWGGIRNKKILLTLARRILRARLTGERIAVSGQALIIRLRLTLKEKGILLQRETPMTALLADEHGQVVGAEVLKRNRRVHILAKHGVILASGGFDHNLPMRQRHQPGVSGDWSLGSATNEGDGIVLGEKLGAMTDLMEDAWWMPTMKSVDGTLVGLVAERQYPGQFIVNEAGKRFVNESAPYVVFCQAQLAGHQTEVGHIPAWMIVDHRAWRRNFIAGHIPGAPMPRQWKKSQDVHSAATLEDLALKIGVPGNALVETAARFNHFARAGTDDDFRRGDSVYDNYYGDPSYSNPNLGEVSKPPYYAFALRPGDLGTKGGLMTDEDARVIRSDGSVIEGLYAAGNVSSSVMGTKYAGPGATLGPAMTSGFIAANDIVARSQTSSRLPDN